MYIRRYYKRGIKYPYTVSDKYKHKLVDMYGDQRADLIDNCDYEIKLEGLEEERAFFKDCCDRIIANPRWYLDNLDNIPSFYVHYSLLFPDFIKWKG